MSRANNPNIKSWVEVKPDSDFPIQNLPFGIYKSKANPEPRIGVAIGEFIIDMNVVQSLGAYDSLQLPPNIFIAKTLNEFIALGKPTTTGVRELLSDFLNTTIGRSPSAIVLEQLLLRQSEAEMLLPVSIPNYTDFYSSKEHATNVGIMFRDPANALLPNWKHIPVGYHGRASSIVVSGTPIHRPMGQTKADDAALPSFGPSRLLDFELEMAFITGISTALGERISTAKAEDAIFGLTLFNDWSARDIQKWEYVPLGPFLGKNFGSTMSPWVVTLEALEPFRTKTPTQEPEVLPYLKFEGNKNFDINLEVQIIPENGQGKIVSRSNFKYMYWNMAQQLAHHTVNGCNIQVGDLYASGTISGPTPDSYGSMLEIAWQGKKPLTMPDGTERKFILDNDTVEMSGYGVKDGVRIGFGECIGKILPAK